MKYVDPDEKASSETGNVYPVVKFDRLELWRAKKDGNDMLHLELAASERRLALALQRIDSLHIRNRLLKQKLGSLARKVLNVYRDAQTDALTGLSNRRVLDDRFNQAIARARRRNWLVALIFADIDNFKQINDTYGHAAGDWLLCEVAVRLSTCTRKSDTVCRYGGDEFLIMIADFELRQTAAHAANVIRSRLEETYFWDDTPINVTVSMGLAVCPDDGERFGDVIRYSDRSMYAAKIQNPELRMIK